MTASQNELLRATSRSFYLTLRVLPAAIRPQIGLAYLLARTADTIADTEIVPLNQRLDALQKFRERVLDKSARQVNFSELAGQQGAPEERLLLEKAADSLDMLQTFSEADQKIIRNVLTTIISGQELDLKRFAHSESTAVDQLMPEPPQVIALETAKELDDYTYRVAGCVGEFWSKLCRAHLFPQLRLDENQFMIDAVRFGKGLQLVNILRDIPADLKKGRCYLPTEKLEKAKLLPQTMLSPINERNFLPLYHEYLDKAEEHLRAGWDYTNTLPFNQFRLRLACAWPILIGIKTIDRLRRASVIDLKQNVKVSRPEVRNMMVRSFMALPFRVLWLNLLPQKQLR
ncbi:MAG TPA: phytoene/squalene synthase family protein [Pseudomonadales bacterium]|nr:phytoene/squalene synthase family protein [Pseudomonadales bacterium]